MTTSDRLRIALMVFLSGLLPGCGAMRAGNNSRERGRQLSESSAQHDFRELRARLKGQSMQTVVKVMGTPAKVHVSGATESWDYHNAAYDSASRRPVRLVTVWFKHSVVDEFFAVY